MGFHDDVPGGFQGEIAVAAPIERVWAALNAPEVVARCLREVAGADAGAGLKAEAGDRLAGTLVAHIGPVEAPLDVVVEWTERQPSRRCRLLAQGDAGLLGSARAAVEVTLADGPAGGTALSWRVRPERSGALAQLDAGLVEGLARGLAERVFLALGAEAETPIPPPEAEPKEALLEAPPVPHTPDAADIRAAVVAAAAEAAVSPARGLPPLVWIGGLVLLVIASLALLLG
ncbi:CoxG family protein [Sandaracinobacteroides sayramensis]|uniref:CoxG family protein n=1 Tax=Sandaracinobacteroides sayramensis TaxID=2913411 RepID=UPI002342E4F8|nr:SRPBCC domain-containing protein [Sandaracinobacteroides sayramensis]